jgi:hypothetical protein
MAAQAYADWGFADASAELVEKMRPWAQLVFRPLLDDRERSLGEGAPSFVTDAGTLWTMKLKLREGSPVRPPGAFVLVARAVIGVGAALVRLNIKLNWHRMFERLLQDFDEGVVAARQAEVLERAGLRAVR